MSLLNSYGLFDPPPWRQSSPFDHSSWRDSFSSPPNIFGPPTLPGLGDAANTPIAAPLFEPLNILGGERDPSFFVMAEEAEPFGEEAEDPSGEPGTGEGPDGLSPAGLAGTFGGMMAGPMGAFAGRALGNLASYASIPEAQRGSLNALSIALNSLPVIGQFLGENPAAQLNNLNTQFELDIEAEGNPADIGGMDPGAGFGAPGEASGIGGPTGADDTSGGSDGSPSDSGDDPGGPFHTGGHVPGKGDVKATLQGGEYVIRKSAVDKYGPGLFGKLNRGEVSASLFD